MLKYIIDEKLIKSGKGNNNIFKEIYSIKKDYTKFKEVVNMTNGDIIRNMTDEDLAYNINFGFPSCNDICEDFGEGCSWNCKYKNKIAGDLKILEWIKKEIK